MRKIITSVVLFLTPLFVVAEETLPEIDVYKSPTCGCCTKWVRHLEDSGFSVVAHNVENLNDYKLKANLPYSLGSCHTAFIDGYAIEGHVPASDIKRLLVEKPSIRGLAVPGMPIGSPGMEFGDRKDPYQTIGYTKDGLTRVFASH
ncbi:hypothetical protein GZ77_23500 [Endozoicomonas montiporae]|uniref:Metal-binding protein n=2 Tax=Endozoicomonas montiporae TaxID=1027273 RepID=A0A081N0S5_9GAMM|nr:DUF411 domain-containing protein [Endozoicomonas montiporae]AMO54530.1 hypothetical protein EZMO1_0265 [Endozoicomonas montiporae CL-33]KEQ12048.1 hypothetical protein GZ77_23500 [Endozoicomonas montiporae]